MRIAVIGTGYVGLVTGTCFAETGNHVTCIDIDQRKIEGLRNRVLPIYEPELDELVQDNVRAGRLQFTTELAEGLAGSQVVFLGVGTPQGRDGSPNLSALWSVVDGIRNCARDNKFVVIKSTVPVGTNARVAARLNAEGHSHRVVSNPEFLKEGYAVEDFMKPDRVVVGTRDPEAAELLRALHAPLLQSDRPFLVMAPESAEMTKYTSNTLLATKISFINEIAGLCERLGADINEVRCGIGHDPRIGFHFLAPGLGYGGSCLPKDVRAVQALAERCGGATHILQAVDEVNERQKVLMAKKLQQVVGNLNGKRIALWGLAFKPRTDDIREAPSLVLIRSLLEAGASVQVHDPKAMENVRRIFGDEITYFDHAYEALVGADALAIVTEWPEFRTPDFELMRRLLRHPVVVDGRNLYEPEEMQLQGFTYSSIGRATVCPPRHAKARPTAVLSRPMTVQPCRVPT